MNITNITRRMDLLDRFRIRLIRGRSDFFFSNQSRTGSSGEQRIEWWACAGDCGEYRGGGASGRGAQDG